MSLPQGIKVNIDYAIKPQISAVLPTLALQFGVSSNIFVTAMVDIAISGTLNLTQGMSTQDGNITVHRFDAGVV
jgi:hypothetical protein